MPREYLHMRASDRSINELISCHQPGYSLARRFYTDPGIFELELDRVVGRTWILAGHESQLPEPGDFKLLNVANESAIIARGDDGRLRAFANVCRHRGSLVCLADAGHTDRFVCPYHGWAYGTDGRLLAARSMNGDFEKSSYGLNPVALEVLHGLVMVCLADVPPGLASARRDLEVAMTAFGFERLKVAACKTYDIPANWKLAVENYQECYHCATAHPEYSLRHTLTVDSRQRERLQQDMRRNAAACGLPDIEIDRIDGNAPPGEMGYGYRRTALFKGYQTGSRDGKALAPLLGELRGFDGGASDLTLGAVSFLLAYSDHVVAYVFTPVDLGNCRCEIYWLVRGDATEGRDYEVDQLTWLWDVTMEADKAIIVNNWKGVQSRYYRPGPFSRMEGAERMWTEWVLGELARP